MVRMRRTDGTGESVRKRVEQKLTQRLCLTARDTRERDDKMISLTMLASLVRSIIRRGLARETV